MLLAAKFGQRLNQVNEHISDQVQTLLHDELQNFKCGPRKLLTFFLKTLTDQIQHNLPARFDGLLKFEHSLVNCKEHELFQFFPFTATLGENFFEDFEKLSLVLEIVEFLLLKEFFSELFEGVD